MQNLRRILNERRSIEIGKVIRNRGFFTKKFKFIYCHDSQTCRRIGETKMIYKTFKEWKAGRWLEDGEPRTEAYTEDELLLVEMGWKYGFDAGKEQTKPLSDEEIHDIWKSLWEGGNIGHIAYNYARAIEERHGIK